MSDPNDARSRSGYRPIPEQPRPRPRPQPVAPQPDPQAPYPSEPYPSEPYPSEPYPSAPYPSAPYPSAPYPSAPYPQQPYLPTAYSASGGRHRRLSLVWVGVGLVAAVGIGLGAGALIVPSDQLPTPIGDLRIGAAPRAVAPYHRMAGARANRVTHRVRNAMTASNATSAHLYGDALVAAYALPGSRGPDLLVVANDADNATVVRLLRAGSGDQDRARQFVSAIGAEHVQDYPSAPLSGSLQCGTQGGLDATVCVWFDASTFGYVVDYAADPPKQVAGVTVRMRSATEH